MQARAPETIMQKACLQNYGDFLASDFSYTNPSLSELEHDVYSTCAHPFTLLGGVF